MNSSFRIPSSGSFPPQPDKAQIACCQKGPALLDRDWMKVLTLPYVDSHTNYCMQNNKELDKLSQKLRALFLDELGKLEGAKVKLHEDTSHHPRFCKARAMPLALQKK